MAAQADAAGRGQHHLELGDRFAGCANVQCPRLKGPSGHLWLANTVETYVSPDRPIADNRHPSATRALNQQRIAVVLRPFATDIQNDPPALTPVAVDAVNHDALVACDGNGSGVAYTADKRLRRLLAMVRFSQCCERRTDQ